MIFMMDGKFCALTNSRPAPGSKEAPPHSPPPSVPGAAIVPCRLGGVYKVPARMSAATLDTYSRASGEMLVGSKRWAAYGGGFSGKGWVGQAFSPGISEAGTGRSSIGNIGS